MPSNYKQVIRGFARKSKALPLAVAQDVAAELATTMIRLTPIDTTRCIANWLTAINTVPQEFDSAKRDEGGRASITRAQRIAKRLRIGNAFVVANSTPYIFFLEDGSSAQAPAGMRKVTIAAFPRIVERAIARQAQTRNGIP